MTDIAVMATGLRFPEGPVVLKDGSIALVEIARGTVSRVALDGTVSVIAEPGGGPNGLALGPDGMLYVCNNGGFAWHEEPGMIRPIGTPETYSGGRIERIDPRTGACTVLYESCGDTRLKGPNDIVFDRTGGFYFTDLGKARHRDRDQGSVYYARADGSFITECVHPILTPNGIGSRRTRRCSTSPNRGRAALGFRPRRAGQDPEPSVPLAAWRPLPVQPGGLPALR